MTIEQLLSKREEILESLGISRISFGERSLEHGRHKEALAVIDAEIQRLTQSSRRPVSYAEFRNG